MNRALIDNPVLKSVFDSNPLTPQEERERLAGSELSHEDRMELVMLNARWAATFCNSYARGGVVSEQDIECAIVGMVKAAMTFDPESGTRFISWANQYMENEIVGQRNLLDFPCQLKAHSKKARTVWRDRVEAIPGRSEFDWSATAKGVAREVGIKEREAASTMMVCARHFSMDSENVDKGCLSFAACDPEDSVDCSDMAEKAMRVLTKNERECIDLYFGISSDRGGINIYEIASRLDKSPQTVSSTIARAIKKMQGCRAVHEYRRLAG